MIDKEYTLKKFIKIDDKLFISKILDKVIKTQKTKAVTYTDFLDPYQRVLLEKALSDNNEVDFVFDGGYEGAERVIAIFRPNFMPFGYEDTDGLFRLIEVTFDSRDKLTHRDYLGSLIGLGIKREKIGDILVRDNGCSIVSIGDISEYIRYNLIKVGNVKVHTELKNMDEISIIEPDTKTINTTVASLRLDCVAGAGFGMSRSKINEFISSEKVFINWNLAANSTKLVKEGDTISIRGKGRLIVDEIGQTTRKGRISVVLMKFI